MRGKITPTRETGPCYYMIKREYASGVVDCLAIKLGADDVLKGKRRKPVPTEDDSAADPAADSAPDRSRKNSDKADMDERSLENSIIRARSLCRRKILSSCPDRMLTLTFRECVDDMKAAWDCFAKFNRMMKWRFKNRWRYVCVPELQKRGAWHFHLAIKGFFPVDTVRRFWLKAVGSYEGNVDITSPRKINKRSWNPRRIASYLAKYLTKAKDAVGFGEKRFSSGGGIPDPVVTRGYMALGTPILSDLVDWLGVPSRVIFWRDDGYPLFFVSG